MFSVAFLLALRSKKYQLGVRRLQLCDVLFSSRLHSSLYIESHTAEYNDSYKWTFRYVYKADDHRPEPRFTERELVGQLAALEFTPEAIRAVLEGGNPHKLAGPDGVQHSLIRILASVLAVPNAELLSCALVDGVSVDWKQAEVIPLHKKGDTRDLGN